MAEIRVPDIGDAENVEVIELCVAPGDGVAPDDPILVVESDKASMEIPAGVAGTVEAVLVGLGDAVAAGQPIARLQVQEAPLDGEAEEHQAAPAGKAEEPAPESHPAQAAQSASPTPEAPDDASSGEDARPMAEAAASPAPASAASQGLALSGAPGPGAQVYAGPATRRLARELGVNLAEVRATGARGRILKDDVKRFVKAAMAAGAGLRDEGGAGIPPVPEIDFSRFGPVQTLPLGRVRALGARNLHRSWLNLPHVTQHEEADLSELEAFRRSLKGEAARRKLKLTLLPFVAQAVCRTLKAFPSFNASLDAAAQNFLVKGYYRIGFAVDTEQGLVVPVLKDAERKGIWTLCAELAELAAKARRQELGMDDMQGGTFTISSLGAAGGTGFTPIINAPEVAILGVARLAAKPVWDGARFQPRQMLPLSLSYDHRAINGAEAGRFLMHLAGLLQDVGCFEL